MSARALTAATVAASLCLLALPAVRSYADSGEDQTIIVTFDKAQHDAPGAAKAAIENAGGQVRQVRPLGNRMAAVTVAAATSSQTSSVTARAEDAAGVEAAEVAGRVHPTTTSDTYYSYLWNINDASGSTYGVDAEDAWPTTTGSGAVIAVLDTGITPHPDLDAHVVSGYDFFDGDANPTDEGPESATEWHGTHVAGIAAALKNSIGVVGVAPGASIEPVRVMGLVPGDTQASGSDAEIIAGIHWASGVSNDGASSSNAHPADVINLSLGGPGGCPVDLQTAIDQAVSAGTAVVVAAGNDSAAIDDTYPANCDNVIRVTASTDEGTLASYSNYGTSSHPATISAPGGSGDSNSATTDWVVSTWSTASGSGWPAAGYAGMVGTSMAAPHVAGIIALLRSADTRLNVSQLTSLVTQNVTALSDDCSTVRCGTGIANANAAVAHLPAPAITDARIAGTAKVASTLTASAVSSTTPGFLSYRWTVSGATVGTGRTFVPSAAQAKQLVSVTVTARVGANSTSATSPALTVAPGTFTKQSSPTASGTFRVGKTIKAAAGRWSPSPEKVSYRWLRSGKSIKGATHTSYKLTRADKGKSISVRVTVARLGYTTSSVNSSGHRVR